MNWNSFFNDLPDVSGILLAAIGAAVVFAPEPIKALESKPKIRWTVAIVLLALGMAGMISSHIQRRDFEAKVAQLTPPRIKPLFRDSALLTETRRDRITADINDFYDYLVKQVGLKISQKSPTIGTGERSFRTGRKPGAEIETALFIPEKHIDDRWVSEQVVGNYLFDEAFDEAVRADNLTLEPGDVEQARAHFASYLVTFYYVSSFNNRKLSLSSDISAAKNGQDLMAVLQRMNFPFKWENALWTMRTKYGQSKMDSMMFVLFTTWRPFGVGGDTDLDTTFAQQLVYASSLMGRPPGEVEGILQAEGIKTGKLQ